MRLNVLMSYFTEVSNLCQVFLPKLDTKVQKICLRKNLMRNVCVNFE